MKKIIFGIASLVISANVLAHSQYMTTETMDLSGKTSAKVGILFNHPSEGKEEVSIDVSYVDGVKNPMQKAFIVHKDNTLDVTSKFVEKEIKADKNTAKYWQFDFTQEEGLKGNGMWIIAAVPGDTKDGDWSFHFANKLIVVKDGGRGAWNTRVLEGEPEIIPFGNPARMWKEDIFRAQFVGSDGKPVANARVDIDFLNAKVDFEKGTYEGGEFKGTFEEKISNRVFTDENGIFAFAVPKSGQWVLRAVEKMDRDAKTNRNASLVVQFD